MDNQSEFKDVVGYQPDEEPQLVTVPRWIEIPHRSVVELLDTTLYCWIDGAFAYNTCEELVYL